MSIQTRDKKVIWHPFTQHQQSDEALSIVRGEGAYLFDENGKAYLDLISSWWVNLHGHCHPDISHAIYRQANQLEHIIFSGFTHEPAVSLAEQLLTLFDNKFHKVFYSDNGSTAVEVALKMAYQYWRNTGKSERTQFIAFNHAYHGDTFGAMSLGKSSGFFNQFEDLFFKVNFFNYPETWMDDATIDLKESEILKQIKRFLEEHGSTTAALIIEPLVQGASGMNMCRPIFLLELEKLVRQYNVLIIYDEVMTGFGRIGKDLFACQAAQTTPDIICLAKGLTGGFLPLAATLCREEIFNAFLAENFTKALSHGHTFTANPLGCAAALASLKILKHEGTKSKIQQIEEAHHKGLMSLLSADLAIEKLRVCGTIAAFNLPFSSEYSSKTSLTLREKFIKKGFLIRPLGNVIYLLPPYCINEDELKETYECILQELQGVMA